MSVSKQRAQEKERAMLRPCGLALYSKMGVLARKLLAAMLAVMVGLSFAGCTGAPVPTDPTEPAGGETVGPAGDKPSGSPETLQGDPSTIVWREAGPYEDGTVMSYSSSMIPFDMRYLLRRTDFVFRGRILAHQDYDVSYTNRDGVNMGPSPACILTVRVVEAFLGRPTIDTDTLRIFFSGQTTMDSSSAFALVDGKEYIFFASVFGEIFDSEELIGTPWTRSEMEKRADMWMGQLPEYNAYPYENGMVVASVQYNLAGRGISLSRPGDARGLVPEAFRSYEGNEYVDQLYMLYSVDDLIDAIRQVAAEEGRPLR